MMEVAQSNTRQCTKCLEDLSLENFYSKGDRIDSQCKKCVCSNKKAKYVTKHDELNFDTLMKIFSLIQELELTSINLEIKKLDKVIILCKNKIQQ